jgi:hypothetical protein
MIKKFIVVAILSTIYTSNIEAGSMKQSGIGSLMVTPASNGPIFLATDEHLNTDVLMREQFKLPPKTKAMPNANIETDYRASSKQQQSYKRSNSPSFSDIVAKQSNNANAQTEELSFHNIPVF